MSDTQAVPNRVTDPSAARGSLSGRPRIARRRIRGRFFAGASATAAAAVLCLGAGSAPAEELSPAIEQYEAKVTTILFGKLLDRARRDTEQGDRASAVHWLNLARRLRPEDGTVAGMLARLRDPDQPPRDGASWRSPRATPTAAFREDADEMDQTYVWVRTKIGRFASKQPGDAARARAMEHFLEAMRVRGGPFAVDGEGQIQLGRSAVIPQLPSQSLIDQELVEIGDRLWRRRPEERRAWRGAAIEQSDGEAISIRAAADLGHAVELRSLVEAAWPAWTAESGRSPRRRLHIAVLPDRAAFDRWVQESAAVEGPSNATLHHLDDLAVTWAHPELEAALPDVVGRLFHRAAFETTMPDWYERGFAAVARSLEPAAAAPPTRQEVQDALEGRPGSAAAARSLYRFMRSSSGAVHRERMVEWEAFALTCGADDSGASATRSLLARCRGVDVAAAVVAAEGQE